jgi:hypothetical protein
MEVLIGGYLIFVLLFAAGLGLIPAFIAREKGYSFGLWWLYGWMLFIVAIIHVTLIPDKNAPSAPPPRPKTPPIGAADEIRRYKELLDEGVITQEEFEQKKTQLLNL